MYILNADLELVCVCAYICYIHVQVIYMLYICIVYILHIHSIFHVYVDLRHINELECTWYIIGIISLKKVLNKPIRYRLGISKGYARDLHIQRIFIVYTMYIQCIYIVYTVTSTYSKNIHCIYHVYEWYIHCIYSDICIYIV